MFHISSCLRVMFVIVALMMLMVLPALAGAPPAPKPSPPVPMVPSPTNPAILVECPPCEFCNMYRVNPNGPKVAAPQLQGASPTASYAPTYLPSGAAPAASAPMQSAPAQYAQPQQAQQAPGTYAVGGYVSNQPMPAGPNPSLGEVWMRHGGARLQYDALRGPIQMNTNGRPLKDPALVHAPPLYPKPRVVRARVTKPKVTATKKVTPAPAVVKGSVSHKPVAKPVAKPVLTPASVKPTTPVATKPKAEAVAPKTEPTPTAKAPASPAQNAAPVRAMPRTASPSLLEDYGPEGISRPAGSTSSLYDGPAQSVGTR